jgi:hypothetical protein
MSATILRRMRLIRVWWAFKKHTYECGIALSIGTCLHCLEVRYEERKEEIFRVKGAIGKQRD